MILQIGTSCVNQNNSIFFLCLYISSNIPFRIYIASIYRELIIQSLTYLEIMKFDYYLSIDYQSYSLSINYQLIPSFIVILYLKIQFLYNFLIELLSIEQIKSIKYSTKERNKL
ncbi:hypothetical protein pb186bvf_000876 [Paramecium bursaria]